MIGFTDSVLVAIISGACLIATAAIPLIAIVLTRVVNGASDRVMVRNTAEHEVNKGVLDMIVVTQARVEEKVDGIAENLSDHLNWHVSHPSKDRAA